MSNKVLCIAGKNEVAVNALRFAHNELGKEITIKCLPNRNDEGVDSWQPSLRKAAQSLNIEVIQASELYAEPNLCLISLEYAHLLSVSKFTSDQLFNIHFSLLPKYRGMYTSALPILHGESETGVTLHQIDYGIDTGAIIDQSKFAIESYDTARDLYFKYMSQSFLLFKSNLTKLLDQSYSLTQQPVTGASYYSKKAIDYGNLSIDFNKTAYEVYNQLRAFTFEEYQLPIVQGVEIYKSQIENSRSTLKPGRIVAQSDHSMTISTIDYNITLYTQKDHSLGS